MIMMEIKKKYLALGKKHKLPGFESLDQDFEISTIEFYDFLLREIRRKMTEKIEIFIKVLDGVLQPEAVICDMQECHVFNDDEKSKVYEVYKKLMYYNRLSFETAIDEDDKKSAFFIQSFFDDWRNLKKELSEILSKMKDSWEKESSIHEVLNYLG